MNSDGEMVRVASAVFNGNPNAGAFLAPSRRNRLGNASDVFP